MHVYDRLTLFEPTCPSGELSEPGVTLPAYATSTHANTFTLDFSDPSSRAFGRRGLGGSAADPSLEANPSLESPGSSPSDDTPFFSSCPRSRSGLTGPDVPGLFVSDIALPQGTCESSEDGTKQHGDNRRDTASRQTLKSRNQMEVVTMAAEHLGRKPCQGRACSTPSG